MCGICGFVPLSPEDPAAVLRRLQAMNGTLVHRGPDDEGYYSDPHAGLAMRRLSIIDLAGGRQPMENEDGRLRIVFNGEIYNYRELRERLVAAGHRFRTQSDTETVLHGFEEHGEDIVRRLEGMFAFAVWDLRDRRLFLARDWLGQKPLYYARLRDGFHFSSEPKTFLAIPEFRRSLDVVSLSHFLTLRSLPGDGTLLEGLHKLPAATRGWLEGGELRLDRYWKLVYGPKHPGRASVILDELDEVLGGAVRSHMVADVPIGGFLSGGIDSSTVCAMMANAASGPVHTFSIGVEDEDFDERPFARMVAARYRTNHHEEVVAPDLVAMLPRMIHFMDEPVDPFAAGVYMVSSAAAKHAKVALGGDGGDEMFGGYDRYLGQSLLEIYAALPRFLRNRILGPLLRRFPETFAYKSFAQKLKWIDRISDIGDPAERYAYSAGYLRFPHERKERLFAPGLWARLRQLDSEEVVADLFRERSADALLDRVLYADVETRLAEHLLPTVDRMSMAHSLEVRSPYLDRSVAEFAARMPPSMKVRRLRLKYALRRLSARYLPRRLVVRRKQGFGFPLAHWFRVELRGFLHAAFADSALVEDGVLRRDGIVDLLDEHGRMAMDHNYRIWLLLNLELWYRIAVRGQSVPEVEEFVARRRKPESVAVG
ncbi:MAG: asparagine synthase (glutamine-hydrolyzing) [Candidatus Binatia bacterium]